MAEAGANADASSPDGASTTDGERDEEARASLANVLRVLAFEDVYDIAEMLERGGVDVASRLALTQRWTSDGCVEAIAAYEPDVLLLDYYMPAHTGLAVLQLVNEAVRTGILKRPKYIIGMSSEAACNDLMLREGADDAFVKWDISRWDGWHL